MLVSRPLSSRMVSNLFRNVIPVPSNSQLKHYKKITPLLEKEVDVSSPACRHVRGRSRLSSARHWTIDSCNELLSCGIMSGKIVLCANHVCSVLRQFS